MHILWIILLSLAGWIAFLAVIQYGVTPWLAAGPNRDPLIGIMWRVVRVYAKLVHRVSFHGMVELRRQIDPGPLIVVSNHTGSVDPLLIQAGCRFQIRWMMASEMMTQWLDFVWKKVEPIPVDRDGRDLAPTREALRYLAQGGVVGIFPEGRIVWPPKQLRPFHSGVGLIVARSKAPVLLVWVSGTPNSRQLTGSLLTPSDATVKYIELIDFKGERDAAKITDRLRNRIAQVSRWPLNDEKQD